MMQQHSDGPMMERKSEPVGPHLMQPMTESKHEPVGPHLMQDQGNTPRLLRFGQQQHQFRPKQDALRQQPQQDISNPMLQVL
jgi:hypothetical protein